VDLPMTPRRLSLVALACASFGALFGARDAFAQPPPQLPGVTYTPASANGQSPSQPKVTATPASPAPVTEARRGLVTLERDGHLIGVGTVLNGDGRILTALSVLGPKDTVDVRYADGHVVHTKVGHRDKEWDLALLVPQTGKWTEGLAASEADPGTGDLKVYFPAGVGKTASILSHLKARVQARDKEGNLLANAMELDLKNVPVAGAPIIDATGNVVGVFVRVCKPGPPQPLNGPALDAAAPPSGCTPVTYGAPVSALRSFLMRTPSNAVAPSPWLGIVGTADDEAATHGVRVMAVAPGSPAEKGGLKANPDKTKAHMIVAVDGVPVDSPDKLADAIGKHSVGDKVKLLVMEAGKLKELEVALKAAP
ncbi:MAG: trypsin-like peptidase domain-containing protein, partial [Polyangiaceae bacterium]